jgi:hypothetical protein
MRYLLGLLALAWVNIAHATVYDITLDKGSSTSLTVLTPATGYEYPLQGRFLSAAPQLLASRLRATGRDLGEALFDSAATGKTGRLQPTGTMIWD